MRFSRNYQTFEEWLATQRNHGSKYVQRIIKAHAKYPNAALKELRGHGINPLRYPKRKPLYERRWGQLSPKQKHLRVLSLEVVSEARRFPNRNPAKLAGNKNLRLSDVRRSTGAFHKEGNRWVVNPIDNVPRLMYVYSNGKDFLIEVNDSDQASLLGEYFDAVRWFLFKNEPNRLKYFEGVSVVDSNINPYPLETNPQKILDIVERREEPEFYSIYGN